ncbi:MAG: hypothetical protein BAA04_07290 [Firmicutes bacterium ZCTH02-B6]|nr:MAG: hypothetical protein BAA04_07290 [Firmicutes bacterium ZCTH02-B6]
MMRMAKPKGWNTTVGKKVIMGLTGLFLVLYLIVHLAGNLTAFVPDGGRTMNLYSHTLHKLGPLLWVVRILLLLGFIYHIVTGVQVTLRNRGARANRYAKYASKGGPSKMTPASRWMIITGILIAIFVPLHVNMFSLGPYYETVINGEPMRDIYRLVVERFKEPGVAFGYAAFMLFLCAHLIHGIWSAFQSLGANDRRWMPFLYGLGTVLSLLIAGGFFVLPIYTYFFIPLP